MKIHPLHSWDLTPVEAVALQRKLANRIDTTRPLGHWDLVAAADVSYARFSSLFYAGVVVVRTADWTVVEKQGAVCVSPFPYVPGLLSFREAPALLQAIAKLKSEPDAFMFDGQGLAHPRRMGLACHVGLWLKKPSLGCAKTRLIGEYQEPGKKAGSRRHLKDKGEIVGSVVRTRDNVQPVFVSVGHRLDLASAVRLVLSSCRNCRLPEPARLAHQHVNWMRQNEGNWQ